MERGKLSAEEKETLEAQLRHHTDILIDICRRLHDEFPEIEDNDWQEVYKRNGVSTDLNPDNPDDEKYES